MSDLRAYLQSLARPLRIVVTGGRHYVNAGRVAWALGGLHGAYGIARLAHGACGRRTSDDTFIGADLLADAWALDAWVPEVVPYPVTPAEWDALGKRAGPVRNRIMLDEERPDLVVAFPGGCGTSDCRRAARERGIRVWGVPHG